MVEIAYLRKDNWLDFNYDQRVCDAISGLCHSQSPCVSLIIVENTVILSYNNSINDITRNYLMFINNLLNNIANFNIETLLGFYLLFNVDYKKKLKVSKNHVINVYTKQILLDLIILINRAYTEQFDLKGKLVVKLHDENINKLIFNYKYMLEHFSKDTRLHKHLHALLRPFQDCHKIYYYWKNKNIGIIPIDNDNRDHAEFNINTYRVNNNINVDYAGVSKLCCGYCHYVYKDAKILHRGTHGICDESGLSYPIHITKIIEDDQRHVPNQFRDLSFDDFEVNIPELYRYKKILGLYI